MSLDFLSGGLSFKVKLLEQSGPQPPQHKLGNSGSRAARGLRSSTFSGCPRPLSNGDAEQRREGWHREALAPAAEAGVGLAGAGAPAACRSSHEAESAGR